LYRKSLLQHGQWQLHVLFAQLSFRFLGGDIIVGIVGLLFALHVVLKKDYRFQFLDTLSRFYGANGVTVAWIPSNKVHWKPLMKIQYPNYNDC
jgi:hypothetical protein